MKIAVIGTGIAGNVVSHHLHKEHDITVFEVNDYVGGHTHTHDVTLGDHNYAVDTGFIVFNYKTYPHFSRLLQELGVEVQPSSMSFSVKCERTGLEYNGTSLNTLFAQRRNLIRPSFYRMIRDILRFYREAANLLDTGRADMPLGELLRRDGYSSEFIEQHLIPMGAAVWSANPAQMFEFPAGFFIRFFHNHGMLNIHDRPAWYVIKGGSKEYVKKMTRPFIDRIRPGAGVRSITRHYNNVELRLYNGEIHKFDQVFIAAHSNQALRMLTDASTQERTVLGAIKYQKNEAILHTDAAVLPRHKLAWAAWNYHILPAEQDRVALTYNMNILQGITSPSTFCVTLNNARAINPEKIIKRLHYEHPVFTREGVAAQQRQSEINGVNRTYFCGAYWRNGFHEDGVWSALNALAHFKEKNNAQLFLRRAS